MEGDHIPRAACAYKIISIHALRVEGDLHAHGVSRFSVRISIHALRVEGDNSALQPQCTFMVFLSTPSGWRATKAHGFAVA